MLYLLPGCHNNLATHKYPTYSDKNDSFGSTSEDKSQLEMSSIKIETFFNGVHEYQLSQCDERSLVVVVAARGESRYRYLRNGQSCY